MTGVKRGRGNLGARGRVGRGPRVWSRALIPCHAGYMWTGANDSTTLSMDVFFVFVLKTKKKSQDILSRFVWTGSLSTACCEEQPFLAFHISDYTNSGRCIFSM